METFTVFKNQKGIGIRFDTQALPSGSFVIAIGDDEGTKVFDHQQADDAMLAGIIEFGQQVLADDTDAQFAPGI